MIRLDGWAVVPCGGNRYTAPELLPRALTGIVFGHPGHQDGKHVTTSQIVAVYKRTVTTRSGTTYRLGPIDRRYRAFLRKQGIPFDPACPIKWIGGSAA